LDVTWHFRGLPSRWNLLTVVQGSPHTLARQLGDMSHRVFVGVTVCGQVIKIGNAGDKTTVALAIDHCPIPNSVHPPPLHTQATTKGVSRGKSRLIEQADRNPELERLMKVERLALEHYDRLRGYPGDVQEVALALWTEATEAGRDYRAKHP
jgi:hypothetical protein